MCLYKILLDANKEQILRALTNPNLKKKNMYNCHFIPLGK